MQSITDWLTTLIDAAPAGAVYAVAFAALYLETSVIVVGLVLPSEGLLIAAGVLAAIGPPNIGILVAGCGLAAILGDWTGYLVGRGFGPRLAASRMGKRIARRTVRARHRTPNPNDAVVVVAAARWVGFVRSVIPLVAGARGMPFARFALASAIGAVSWTATVLLVSYGVGATLGAEVALYVAVAVGLASVGFLIYRRSRSGQERTGSDFS
ncbi:DedA family protein [Gordonia zhaorongruii]|uniref:DedA family protein n=1 Tax=Gordonia zhaorongruii TaxID=2597659 RepID=UPI0010514277|nr:DedA family protein [Gordonia zhaorongruii]